MSTGIGSTPPPTNDDISVFSAMTSNTNSPTSLSRKSSFNDHTSSIKSAGEPPEAKSLLTWVYEGFCHILALIWNFFSPPTESPPMSRKGSQNSLASNQDISIDEGEQTGGGFDITDPRFQEHYFELTGESQDDLDQRSDRSGFGSQSDTSAVMVGRPSSETSSHISQGSSVPSQGTSEVSNPMSSTSNTGSTHTDTLITEAHYALSRSNDLDKEEALLPFCDRVIDRSLKITVQRRADIQEVLKTIGENTALGLVASGLIPRLKELGSNIDREVHPYRFLIEIFTDPPSKASLIALYDGKNSISGVLAGRLTMWNEFAADLGKSFELRKEDTMPHTKFFVDALKADYRSKTHQLFKITPAQIDNFVIAKNWNGLLEHLIKHTKTTT